MNRSNQFTKVFICVNWAKVNSSTLYKNKNETKAKPKPNNHNNNNKKWLRRQKQSDTKKGACREIEMCFMFVTICVKFACSDDGEFIHVAVDLMIFCGCCLFKYIEHFDSSTENKIKNTLVYPARIYIFTHRIYALYFLFRQSLGFSCNNVLSHSHLFLRATFMFD